MSTVSEPLGLCLKKKKKSKGVALASLELFCVCVVGAGWVKTDGSWWRVLTECGPLERRMANHSSILALRTP